MRRSSILSLLLWLLALPAYAFEVQEVKADGLMAWLVEDHHLPVIEMQMVFKQAGSITDAIETLGRAELAGAVLTEGAGDLDSGAFHRALENKAIGIDVSVGRDHLQISLKTLSEHKETAFALLGDMLLRPRFDEASIDEAKARFAIARRRQQESPYYLAAEAFNQKAYVHHPYAREALGTAETMARIKTADLHAYQKDYVSKANAVISVSGDITAEQLQQLMSRQFGALPEASKQPDLDYAHMPAKAFDIALDKQLPQTVWYFVRDGVLRDDPYFYAAYLLNHIVGGGSSLTSRLGEEVRKKRGLTYGIGTSLNQSLYAKRISGAVATQNDTAEETKQAIEDVFSHVQSEGVSEAELRSAKDYVKGSFPLKVASNAGVASYLTAMQLYDLGRDYFDKRNTLFEAVTLQQVNEAAKMLYHSDQWSWVRIGGKTALQKPKEEVSP